MAEFILCLYFFSGFYEIVIFGTFLVISRVEWIEYLLILN